MAAAGTGQDMNNFRHTVFEPERQLERSNDCAFYTFLNAAYYGVQEARPTETSVRTNWPDRLMVPTTENVPARDRVPERRQLLADLATATNIAAVRPLQFSMRPLEGDRFSRDYSAYIQVQAARSSEYWYRSDLERH